VVAAGDAYADFFAPIEGLPRNAKALQTAPPAGVLNGPRGWREYELGRRFELGVGGLPQDRTCAMVWYAAAAESPYEELDWGPGAGVTPPTVTHVGVPFARIALRRLGYRAGANPATDVYARCRGLASVPRARVGR
jgi:hypothetical protein